MDKAISEILNYWFGPLNKNGVCVEPRNALWFKASAETDAHCTQTFNEPLNRAIKGELNAWTTTDEGLVALIVLLDQFSRNIHRGNAKAFAGDSLALHHSMQAIKTGRDTRLPAIHRLFIYLPLEHSEDLATQEHCVMLFEKLANDTNDELFSGFVRYAVAHRDVIAKFGRFPHRNEILGRPSTPQELEHMQTHGGF